MVGSGKIKRVRRSQVEWRALLSRFQSSASGVEAFCRREGISAASFYRWRSLLSDTTSALEANGAMRTPAFVDLGALNAPSASKARLDLKLDLGDGLILHLVRS